MDTTVLFLLSITAASSPIPSILDEFFKSNFDLILLIRPNSPIEDRGVNLTLTNDKVPKI